MTVASCILQGAINLVMSIYRAEFVIPGQTGRTARHGHGHGEARHAAAWP
jgi:hypothetical protein